MKWSFSLPTVFIQSRRGAFSVQLYTSVCVDCHMHMYTHGVYSLGVHGKTKANIKCLSQLFSTSFCLDRYSTELEADCVTWTGWPTCPKDCLSPPYLLPALGLQEHSTGHGFSVGNGDLNPGSRPQLHYFHLILLSPFRQNHSFQISRVDKLKILVGFLLILSLCVHVQICTFCVCVQLWVPLCHGVCVEFRGQLCQLGFLLCEEKP